MPNVKLGIKTEGYGTEYPNMTFEEVKKMVEYLNQGISEVEARQKVLDERVSN